MNVYMDFFPYCAFFASLIYCSCYGWEGGAGPAHCINPPSARLCESGIWMQPLQMCFLALKRGAACVRCDGCRRRLPSSAGIKCTLHKSIKSSSLQKEAVHCRTRPREKPEPLGGVRKTRECNSASAPPRSHEEERSKRNSAQEA